MRALIVDDSRAIRLMLKRSLGDCGFDEFLEAGNGQEALDALGQADHVPDAAFVDWNMPVMTGIEFLRAARANPAYAAMAILMVTSETSFEFMAEAIESGADEYIMKPFTPDALRQKLDIVRSTRT
ncbi:MAG: response regulator [Actinomycetota bacterium]|nr:response regulator [Actinomycetota bacterium]